MSFIDELNTTLNENKNLSMTENGAIGYRTTGKKLVDLNFSVASMRSWSDEKIYKAFIDAFNENKELAMRWLLFARDIRGGLGERRLFRVILSNIAKDYPEAIAALVPFIAEYGRFDDLWCLFGTEVENVVIDFIDSQLGHDMIEMRARHPISLMAKWLPSINASSKATVDNAKLICSKLKISYADYRKVLSKLRAYLKVVERDMSANQWDKIDYEAVPSRANLIYRNAFLRNDETRRREYLARLTKGEAKINAGTLYPHDIVNRYMDSDWNYWNAGRTPPFDPSLEEMWKALPDTVKGDESTIVVADGSGSMGISIGNTSITALDVANSLAIYFAERCKGQFKDKYITFSAHPQLVDFSNASSLKEKIDIALTHNECANTDIEAVFYLILSTAVGANMSQKDLPKNILIISDMEFDSSQGYGDRMNAPLFSRIQANFKRHDYTVPRLVFWNVNSRTDTIPVKENENGVALVSGFSPNIAKMVMSGKLDPYECLKETLMDSKYDVVNELICRHLI